MALYRYQCGIILDINGLYLMTVWLFMGINVEFVNIYKLLISNGSMALYRYQCGIILYMNCLYLMTVWLFIGINVGLYYI